MSVNKVVYNNRALIDLTEDTISPDSLKQGVTAHDAKGDAIVGTASMDETPDYIVQASDSLALKIMSHIGSDSIVFAALSDAHMGYYTDTANDAGRDAGLALERINKRVPFNFVANLGDYTTGAYNTTVESAMKDMADYQLLIGSKFVGSQIWCVGNHDDAPYQETKNRLTQAQIFAAISRKNIIGGGYLQGSSSYGYMDFPELELRAIYLDTHDRRGFDGKRVTSGANDYADVENIGVEQLRYLVNNALDFTGIDSTKWSILVFSHAALNTKGAYTDPSGNSHACNTENAAEILYAYSSKKSGAVKHGSTSIGYDFTSIEPAKVIGCIHGHEHRFSNEFVGGGLLSICCPNVMNGRERVSLDGNTYTKTAGTANGTSFCVFTVNRADMKIYVDHYGAGIDRVFNYTVVDPNQPSYRNVLTTAVDTDGSIYGGVGWKKGYRLNSSGVPDGLVNSYLTGFIAIKFGDVVRLQNVKWQYGVTTGLNSGAQRISFYDSTKKHIGQANAAGVAGTLNGTKDANGIWTQFTVKNFSGATLTNVAYFRLNCAGIDDTSVITINEEIN